MGDEIVDDIKEAALQPAETTVDGVTVKARTIDEKIKADKYTRAQSAQTSPTFGIGLARMVPPGSV